MKNYLLLDGREVMVRNCAGGRPLRTRLYQRFPANRKTNRLTPGKHDLDDAVVLAAADKNRSCTIDRNPDRRVRRQVMMIQRDRQSLGQDSAFIA